MPIVNYLTHDGVSHQVEVPVGQSVMRGAVDNEIPGIDADCGGECGCATCHVFVDQAWLDKTGSPSEMEEMMLDFAAAVQDNSRLACQIEVSEQLDGLVVQMPESQH